MIDAESTVHNLDKLFERLLKVCPVTPLSLNETIALVSVPTDFENDSIPDDEAPRFFNPFERLTNLFVRFSSALSAF